MTSSVPTGYKKKPVMLTIQNFSVLPEPFKKLFPEEGYLFMKPVGKFYEVWQYSYESGSDSGILREKVTEEIGLSMILKVKEWNKVAADISRQIMERDAKNREAYLEEVGKLPDFIAGFSRDKDELYDGNGKLVFHIKKEDLQLESFSKLEERVYMAVFGIDKLDF